MKAARPPRLEKRRAADFERELVGRARAWIPSWNLDDSEPDFGLALLKIAARFNSEVAERLDGVGEKMALGFLDWLGLRAEAARPARMPVVFRLAETAREPVMAQRPVKMQVEAGGATVTFETETDIRIVPGTLDILVGVDPAGDRFFLPPPGLSSLDPLEPLPTQWRLKNFAAPGSAVLQLDPGLGLTEGMLVEIDGEQYEIVKAKDDLATIEPQVPAGDGFPGGTRMKKVDVFGPFDAGVRNRQEHELYIGDADLLNVEAEATIEVIGLPQFDDEVSWEYWGKDDEAPADDADPRWRTLERTDARDGKAVTLAKGKGAIEPVLVGATEARWIRASVNLSQAMAIAEGITLRLNPLDPTKPLPELAPAAHEGALPALETFVNSTPSPSQNFYPLGREPRMFDTLYIGSDEALSKAGATARVYFDLADAVFRTMSGVHAGIMGFVMAGIDAAGALHLLRLSSGGMLERMPGREPMRPPGDAALLADIAPVMWVDGGSLFVAVATREEVYVWQEVRPAAASSAWREYGSPLPANPIKPEIAGLVLLAMGGAANLAALRGGRLSSRVAAPGTTPWVKLGVDIAANTPLEIDRIFPVMHATPGSIATRLLALEAPMPINQSLYDVENAIPALLFPAIAPGIQPVAVELANGDLEVVAVDAANPGLLASQVGPILVSPLLGPDWKLPANARLGGRIENGHLAAYAVAAPSQPGDPYALIAWQAYAAALTDILFQYAPGPDIGELQGGVTVVSPPMADALAILPGARRADVFAAKLGGMRVAESANAADLRSVLAVSLPSAVAVQDTIATDHGTQLVAAEVMSGDVPGVGTPANARFFWLDKLLDRPTNPDTHRLFKTAAPAPDQVTVNTNATPFELLFGNAVTSLPNRILVDDGSGTNVRNLIEVISFNAVTHIAEVDQLAAGLGTAVGYWLPSLIQGQIFPGLELNAINGGSWKTDALTYGDIYLPQLTPSRQRVIAHMADALFHPLRLAFGDRIDLTVVPPAIFPFAVDGAVTGWATLFGDASANPALSWEYWNGSGWWHLPIGPGDDETSNLRNSGTIRFQVPDDLEAVDWAGKTNHWIRARLIGGDYGRETVVVITEPIPPPTGKTKQTVVRTTEGIQPPYALDVRIAYAVDQPVTPAFLLTRDSGTLRDQSDANRTPAAEIEIFTPLGVTLARFDAAGSGGAQPDDDPAGICVPDCECPSGTASASPPQHGAEPTAPRQAGAGSGAGKRAFYFGFTSKLLGEPINLLLVVAREGAYDKVAPLRVDALIGDRFVPVVAADETRALGETGLVTMSFSVEPIQAELFGRTLSWLRLTPSGADAEWAPSLGGAYLNAGWARAAETMTRELVGSSEGQPLLTLAVARPPLIKDSLELRVREPLGAEEREALLAQDRARVKSDVVDLPGDWVLWTEVPDPVDCGPADRVYALDEATGTIRFGDGRHGAIPPAGVDSIVAFAYQRTEPGVGGEVPANFVMPRTEINLVSPVESVETVFAADRSAGGVAVESPQQVQRFAAAKLRHRGRAVSGRDLEVIVRQRSAEVVQARCFVRSGRVRLVVVMRGKNPWPSQAQRRELRHMLLEVSPPALAAPGALTIAGPAIRRLRIVLALRVASLDLAGTVASQAKARLVAQFDTEHGGEGGEGWPIGNSPHEDDIAEALLDLRDLDGIASIALFEVDELGAEKPWLRAIGPRELAMLAPEDVRIGFDIPEAVA